jgi:hypothetical protein
MAKGNNARDKIIKEIQKELTCRYRAQSYSFREIAEMVSAETSVKITHITAFNDYIEALEEAKKKVEKTSAYGLISELEKLDRLEHQYWRAWEKSLGNSKKKKLKKKGKTNESAQSEIEEQDVQQNGDVSFLNGIKSCIELRCKMMGYITSNIDIKSGGKELAQITGMKVV